MKIRTTVPADLGEIVKLHRMAFGSDEGEEVAGLTANLLDDPTARPVLSLAAEQHDRLLGHVLFTSVTIVDGKQSAPGQILAPLGVLPDAQGRGVGSELVCAGLAQLKADGIGLVFVLGHPSYYPRFGFEPAGVLGLVAPYPIPEAAADAWMVQELSPGILGHVSGMVRCCSALNHPEHWVE